MGFRYVNVRMLPTFHMERFLEYVYVNMHPESFLRLEHKHADSEAGISPLPVAFKVPCRFLLLDAEYRTM